MYIFFLTGKMEETVSAKRKRIEDDSEDDTGWQLGKSTWSKRLKYLWKKRLYADVIFVVGPNDNCKVLF